MAWVLILVLMEVLFWDDTVRAEIAKRRNVLILVLMEVLFWE